MLVSVIIPCFNVENYIEDCIISVLTQIYSNIEIIAVDDRSSDRTLLLLKEYELSYPGKIRIVENELNKGASYSRNRGLQLAKGEYVQFLDADDILLPDKISHQIKLLSSLPGPVLLAGNYKRLSTSGAFVDRTFDPKTDPWIGIINSALGITSSNLWPRLQLLEIGGWKEGLKSSQEYDLMFRLLKTGIPVEYDQAFLTIVRDRESGSISQGNPAANWKRYIELRIEIFEYLLSNGKLTAEIRNAALQRIFEGVRVLYRLDKTAALEIYNKYISKKYSPRPSSWVTPGYLLFYRTFGFKIAEKIKDIFKKS